MSTNRGGGSYHYYKGPYIKGTCRWCGKKVKPPRRTFCNDKCVNQLMIRRDPGWARDAVFKRDKGICKRCGLDTVALRTLVRKTISHFASRTRNYHKAWFVVEGKRVDTWKSLWEAHHKKAVVEGGGECGLRGYETVCVWCHREETAALAERRALEREAKKPKGAEQLKLIGADNDAGN